MLAPTDIVGVEQPDGSQSGASWRNRRRSTPERIGEQTVDMPVPQITVPVPIQEGVVKVIKLFPAFYPAERISERTVDQIVDASAPQILEEVDEVVKAVSAAEDL